MVESLTKLLFEEKVASLEQKEWSFKGDKPAIIDFYANWCGPCKALAPVFEKTSGSYKDQVDFYKVDVDEEKALASAFNVRSIPTLLFIPKSGQPQVKMGFMNEEELKTAIDTTLLS